MKNSALAAKATGGGTQVLHRAFRLLRALSARDRAGWRLSELSDYCELHHATVHRLLNTLIQEGMVSRDAAHRYRLGPLAFEFGVAVSTRRDWRALAAPALDRLARHIGDTVFFNLRSGHESVCIDRREGSYPLKALTVDIGARRPLCVSAGGAAILDRLPPEDVAQVMAASAPYLARFPATRLAAVQRMLAESRRLGYGYNREMIIPGVKAIGLAVDDAAGQPVAALSVAAVAPRLNHARRREVLALLHTETRALSDRLQEAAERETPVPP